MTGSSRACSGPAFPRDVARRFIELSHANNEGRIRSHGGRTPETTMTTSLEDFAPEFAVAYGKS